MPADRLSPLSMLDMVAAKIAQTSSPIMPPGRTVRAEATYAASTGFFRCMNALSASTPRSLAACICGTSSPEALAAVAASAAARETLSHAA